LVIEKDDKEKKKFDIALENKEKGFLKDIGL
jgi:hypothetical protein